MKLYNQTKRALSWDMGGRTFTCEPFGPVEIPERFIEGTKSRGVPLATTPVAPAAKAHARAEDELEAAAGAELLQLKEKLRLAEASFEAAKEELETERALGAKLKSKADALEVKVREQHDAAKTAAADKAALEAKLAELAAKVAEAESVAKTKPKDPEAPKAKPKA